MNSRVNLFSDAGSWQIEERHISFSKSVITCAASTRTNSECADLPLRKTFACHKFKPIPERWEWLSHARCFFRAFLSRCRKTTKMDWKTWNFVSMYLRRSWNVHSPMSEELKSGTKREPNGYLWIRGSTCFQTPEVDREKNITFLSQNLSKLAPPLLAPILNVQTSHFVKVLFVISLIQSQNGVSGFCAQGAFSELFCRGVVKQRKWTEKLGILCRCICQGCRTSIHRCW